MCCPNCGYQLSGSAGTVGYHRSCSSVSQRHTVRLWGEPDGDENDAPSVKPDTDGFHDLANTLDFVLERAIEFLRTAAFRLNSDDRKLVDDVGLLHDCARLRGNFLHDCSRCARTGINPHYRCEVESRNQLGNGGQVWRLRRAIGAIAREQLDSIGPSSTA